LTRRKKTLDRRSKETCGAVPLKVALKIVLVLSVTGLFWSAHLYLRFGVDQFRAETVRMQHDESLLQRELGAMRSENEALKQPERLYDYARNKLGMVAIGPDQRKTLRIPDEVSERYALARVPLTPPVASANPSAAGWIDSLGDRVRLSRQAQAAITRAGRDE